MTAHSRGSVWNSWRLVVKLSWRYLVPRRLAGNSQAYLGGAALGIGLSLIPLIVVLEVSDGLIEGIKRRYLEVGTYHLQVARWTDKPSISDLDGPKLDRLAGRLESHFGTGTIASREHQGIAIAAVGQKRKVVLVRGIAPNLYSRDAGLRTYLQVKSGEFDLKGEGIVVSGEVARQLILEVGDQLTIVTAIDRGGIGQTPVLIPKLTPLVVRAIVVTGYQELDKLWVFVSQSTADYLLPFRSGNQFIGLKINDPFVNLDTKVKEAYSVAGPGHVVRRWDQIERASYDSFATSRALLLLIMALIVAVATINVASTTVTISLARRREVAFLRSNGLSPVVVFCSLTGSGMLAGVLGAVLGISTGLLLALNINEIIAVVEALTTLVRDMVVSFAYPELELPRKVTFIDLEFYLEEVIIQVDLAKIWIVSGGTIVLSTIASVLPSLRACRTPPIEGLRRSKVNVLD